MSAPESGRMDPRDLTLLADLIAESVAARTAAAAVEPLLTVADVAAWLSASEEWVRDHRGLLGGFRLSDGPRAPLRFRRVDVEAFVSARLKNERSVPADPEERTGDRARVTSGTLGRGLDDLPVRELQPRALPKKAAERRGNALGPATGASASPRPKRTPGGRRSAGDVRSGKEAST